MREEKAFSISDFAKFSRITRDALLFYDKIGLLPPASREGNNYRLYSTGQLAVVNVIRTLQSLGMTLSEIKEFQDHRTPDSIRSLFERQITMIDKKIDDWLRARKLLKFLMQTIDTASHADETKITVEHIPEKEIILGEQNDYSNGRSNYDALFDFYMDMSRKHPDLDLNYPVWGMFSQERIKQRDWTWPDRYYFRNPEGFDRKPAGLYAIGYARGGYGQNDDLCNCVLDYIDANGYEISGPAYMEYPLNEISVAENTNYLACVMITVRKKV